MLSIGILVKYPRGRGCIVLNQMSIVEEALVRMKELQIDGFKTGHTLSPSAHSTAALKWEVE